MRLAARPARLPVTTTTTRPLSAPSVRRPSIIKMAALSNGRDATPPTAPPGHAARVVPDVAAGSAAVAALVRSAADAAIASRGAFTLVLSGGSLVACLAPLAGAADAKHWHIFWADERCVPLSSDDSNYKGACEAFLDKVRWEGERAREGAGRGGGRVSFSPSTPKTQPTRARLGRDVGLSQFLSFFILLSF